METIGVPYHQDELIAGFDVGVPVDTMVRAELGTGSAWERMGVLYDALADVVASHALPVAVVSGGCTTSLGVLAGLQRAGHRPGIIWIDAHGDFNTAQTTPSGYLGGMPLALAVGVGDGVLAGRLGLEPVEADRVLLVGARDLDPPERLLLDEAGVVQRGLELRAADLPPGALLLHVDVDICDPLVVPDLLYPVPGGPGLSAVADLVRACVADGRVLAVDLAATWHQGGPETAVQHHAMRVVHQGLDG
jgi:arginase